MPIYGGSNPNTADTVTSKWAKGSGGPAGNECGLFVAQPIASHDVAGTMLSRNTSGGFSNSIDHAAAGYMAMQPIPLNTMAMQGRPGDKDGRMGSGIGQEGDPCPTLTKAHSHAVAQPVYSFIQASAQKKSTNSVLEELSNTLTARAENNNFAGGVSMAVRRLTPVECERLQGFPDTYTDIKSKGKATPDGPRYKALGNSMAVPVMAWIGKRINEVEELCKPNK
jgi:DNA (cytosine-5)-methyltransferase 1